MAGRYWRKVFDYCADRQSRSRARRVPPPSRTPTGGRPATDALLLELPAKPPKRFPSAPRPYALSTPATPKPPRLRRALRAPLRGRTQTGGRSTTRGAPCVQQPLLAVRPGHDLRRSGGHRLPLVVPRRLPLEHSRPTPSTSSSARAASTATAATPSARTSPTRHGTSVLLPDRGRIRGTACTTLHGTSRGVGGFSPGWVYPGPANRTTLGALHAQHRRSQVRPDQERRRAVPPDFRSTPPRGYARPASPAGVNLNPETTCDKPRIDLSP